MCLTHKQFWSLAPWYQALFFMAVRIPSMEKNAVQKGPEASSKSIMGGGGA